MRTVKKLPNGDTIYEKNAHLLMFKYVADKMGCLKELISPVFFSG
jgi:hypothetical protein